MEWILLAVAGFLGYEWLVNASATAASSSTGTTPVTSQTATQTTATTGTTSVAPVTVAPAVLSNATALQAQVASGALLSISLWNYYNNLSNPGATIILGPTSYGDLPITYAQYQSAFQQSGVDLGPQPLGGLGLIIDLQKMFAGVPMGQGFGAREFKAPLGYQLGYGMGVIEDDALMSAGYIDENPFNEAAAFGGSQSDSTTADFYLAVEGQGS